MKISDVLDTIQKYRLSVKETFKILNFIGFKKLNLIGIDKKLIIIKSEKYLLTLENFYYEDKKILYRKLLSLKEQYKKKELIINVFYLKLYDIEISRKKYLVLSSYDLRKNDFFSFSEKKYFYFDVKLNKFIEIKKSKQGIYSTTNERYILFFQKNSIIIVISRSDFCPKGFELINQLEYKKESIYINNKKTEMNFFKDILEETKYSYSQLSISSYNFKTNEFAQGLIINKEYVLLENEKIYLNEIQKTLNLNKELNLVITHKHFYIVFKDFSFIIKKFNMTKNLEEGLKKNYFNDSNLKEMRFNYANKEIYIIFREFVIFLNSGLFYDNTFQSFISSMEGNYLEEKIKNYKRKLISSYI